MACQINMKRETHRYCAIPTTKKDITKPTVTHANELMEAIADYAKTIKELHTNGNDIDMQHLEKLEELTRKSNTQDSSIAKVFPQIDAAPLPRVPLSTNDNTPRKTRSTARQSQQLPRVDIQSVPRVNSAPPSNDHQPIISSKKRAKNR